MAKLNVLFLHMLLDHLHHSVIFECSLKLRIRPLLTKTLNQLTLHQKKDATDLPVCHLLGDFNLMATAFSQIDSAGFIYVLPQDLVIKALRVFPSKTVIELTTLWLNDVWSAGLGGIAQLISVFHWRSGSTEQFLVLPRGILLLNQTSGRTLMAFTGITGSVLSHYNLESLQVIDNLLASGRTSGWWLLGRPSLHLS